jgi:hypothetical protein
MAVKAEICIGFGGLLAVEFVVGVPELASSKLQIIGGAWGTSSPVVKVTAYATAARMGTPLPPPVMAELD